MSTRKTAYDMIDKETASESIRALISRLERLLSGYNEFHINRNNCTQSSEHTEKYKLEYACNSSHGEAETGRSLADWQAYSTWSVPG